MPDNNLLFLTLQVFSATGGIEKVCKVASKGLNEIVAENEWGQMKVYSMYDRQTDVVEKYLPEYQFSGFNKRKFAFVKESLREGIKSRVVILSHVNLLLVGFLIKLLSPSTRLLLFAHGIEVWGGLSPFRRWMIKRCDLIIPVSHFTKQRMEQLYHIPEHKFRVLNNCLDPFLPLPVHAPKDEALLNKLGLKNTDFVLMTLTRLSFKERYKGYDHVMHSIRELNEKYPQLKYLIIGKYDAAERERLDKIIAELSLQNSIVFTGYVNDEDLALHFNLGDCYIMPSKKEGFGIVFIEAMYYGLPVIAGCIDGSVDALSNGNLGLLVNPDNQEEINAAIEKVVSGREKFLPNQHLLLQNFSFPVYKKKLKEILEHVQCYQC